ncbi:Ribonuclease VapC24 [subsurface metagenome]
MISCDTDLLLHAYNNRSIFHIRAKDFLVKHAGNKDFAICEIDYPGGLMREIWEKASKPDFGRRVIFDARLALTLRNYGVTEFATRNVRHFQGYGFKRVWDPLE